MKWRVRPETCLQAYRAMYSSADVKWFAEQRSSIHVQVPQHPRVSLRGVRAWAAGMAMASFTQRREHRVGPGSIPSLGFV